MWPRTSTGSVVAPSMWQLASRRRTARWQRPTAKLDAAGLSADTVAAGLSGALVSPVITAHPTETRRRTIFDTQNHITRLMRLRLHGQAETEDGMSVETELRRQILTLWQTALIRLSRLKVADEIESGLRYYPAAFFEVIPKVNAAVRDALRSRWPGADLLERPIVRPGSWIGGDRDGNPNVTAEVVRLATGSGVHGADALLRRVGGARAGAFDVGSAGPDRRRAGLNWLPPARNRRVPTSPTGARSG